MKKIIDTLSLWWAAVASAATFVLMITMVTDAVSRKFLGTVPGVYETGMALMVIIMFFSQGYAQKRRAHVSVEILAVRLSLRVQAILEALGALLGVGFFGLMTVLGFIKAWESTVNEEFWYGIIDYPIWPFRWFVPLGAILLTAQLLYTVIEASGRALRNR